MQRKTFLRNIAYTVPAISLADLLSTCNKKDDLSPLNWSGKVIIVGAGASGLMAAQQLIQRTVDVTILEASGVYGGRVRSLKNFADFDVDLGAEEIHGKKSVLYDIAKSFGVSFIPGNTENYIVHGTTLKPESQLSSVSSYNAAINFVNQAVNYYGVDKPVQQHLTLTGISADFHHLINARLGNEYGTDNDHLSIRGITEEDNLWTAGDENYSMANASMLSLLDRQFQNVLSKILYSNPVKKIDYSGNKIAVTTISGEQHTADKIIITVPLSILQCGDILFVPGLPAAKIEAVQKIGIGAGMKIILKFNTAFWPANTGSIYGKGYVPECWVSSYGRGQQHVLTGFIMGTKAATLSSQGSGAVNTVMNELRAIYGGSVPDPVAFYIMDWSKEPFIKGAYSYPIVGGGIPQRQQLATSIDKKIFFAGEATHTKGHNATVHGAMETGKRAAEELIRSLK